MNRVTITLMAVTALTVLSSCRHRDLCYDHPEHALRFSTDITADFNRQWEIDNEGLPFWSAAWPEGYGMEYGDLHPLMPEGILVTAYSEEGTVNARHLSNTGGVMEMTRGANSLLMYNDDTEQIIFDNLHATATARAATRGRSRSTYKGNAFARGPEDEERTVEMPDPLFVAAIDGYIQEAVTSAAPLSATLQPVVFSYLVRFEFDHGIEYVGRARGVLAGMAESVYLFDGYTSKEKASYLFDCTVEDWGAQAIVKTFGIPDFPGILQWPTRGDDTFALNLELRLRNGKMLSFDCDVTDQVAAQPRGGVIVVTGLRVSDEEGKQDAPSGFDVDVDGWGEFEDIPIIL